VRARDRRELEHRRCRNEAGEALTPIAYQSCASRDAALRSGLRARGCDWCWQAQRAVRVTHEQRQPSAEVGGAMKVWQVTPGLAVRWPPDDGACRHRAREKETEHGEQASLPSGKARMEDQGSGRRTDLRLSGLREDARPAASIQNGLAPDGTAWFIPAMTNPMLKPIAERWRAWRAPQARQARKAHRRWEWDEAMSEAQAQSRARRHAPSPTEAYTKNTKR
jgi:hypothetical protein